MMSTVKTNTSKFSLFVEVVFNTQEKQDELKLLGVVFVCHFATKSDDTMPASCAGFQGCLQPDHCLYIVFGKMQILCA